MNHTLFCVLRLGFEHIVVDVFVDPAIKPCGCENKMENIAHFFISANFLGRQTLSCSAFFIKKK